MAKRVASSDLNHDNWDKEEESEDAGTFKTATEEAMKGRVVKKAKRRNLNEDQKKNVFSGISFSSGFSSTTDAFSFLKKDTNGSSESKENVPSKPSFGFVFGGSKPKEDFAPKPFGGFEFGTKKTETVKEEEKKEPEPEPEKPTNDLMSKFKPACGNWSCDVCMISNKADVSKCVACETPKPGSKNEEKTEETKELSIGANGGFKFGGSATTEPATTGGFSFGSGSTETKPSGDLNSLFKPATGSWACDVCMISNKADVTKCVACETPKPGAVIEAKEEEKKEFSFGSSGGFKFGGSATSEPATTGGFSFGSASTETKPSGDLNSLFKPATGSWACDVCMISNKADISQCVACETPKPGAVIEAKEEEKKEFSFGSGGGFKFGASATSEPASTGGFSFGNQTSEEKAADDLNPLFKPATDREEEKKEFSFGSSGGFKFGASTTSEPTGGFFFGTKTSEEKSTEPGPKIEELTDGSTGGFQFVASTTAESAKTGGVFTQASSNKTGFMSGSSTVKENENAGAKAGGLFEAPKGPFGTPAGKTSSNKSPQEMSSNRLEYLGFVKALNLQVASCITKHVDRNPLIDLSPVFEDYQKHMKGIREKHGIQPKTQKSPMPSEISEQRSGEDAIEASTETMVQEETVKPVVEEEAFFSTKCKLFYLKEGKYEERGKGHIHLKKTKDLKTQVIIRSENVLGSILLNVIKTKDTRCEIVGDNNVLMVCVPNPPLAGEPVGPVSFLVRVKAEFCEDLFNHLESTKD